MVWRVENESVNRFEDGPADGHGTVPRTDGF